MSQAPDFVDFPDLAAERVGGAAIGTNDDFFAEKENLLKAHEAEWKDHEYTHKGKWMDGWESRRRREVGSDWCTVRLGLPGVMVRRPNPPRGEGVETVAAALGWLERRI